MASKQIAKGDRVSLAAAELAGVLGNDTPDTESIPEVPDVPGVNTGEAANPLEEFPGYDNENFPEVPDGDEGGEGAGTPPAAQQAAAPGTETPPANAPTEEEIAAWRQQAEEGNNLTNMLLNSPEQVAQLLLNQMTPQQRQQVLSALGVPQGAPHAAAPPDELGFPEEQLSPAERVAWQHREFIRSAPQRLEEVNAHLQQQQQAMQGIALDRDFHVARLEVMLETLAEAAGLQLPQIDPATDIPAIQALLSQRKDVRTAVRDIYGKKVKTAVEARKPKPQPRTPVDGSGQGPTLPPGKVTLAQIISFAKQNGRLPSS